MSAIATYGQVGEASPSPFDQLHRESGIRLTNWATTANVIVP